MKQVLKFVPSAMGKRKGWCFVAGTLVTMADGSYKPIEDIDLGDMVMAADGKTANEVVNLLDRESETVALSVFGLGKTTCTPDHPFLTEDGQWVEAENLLGKKVVVPKIPLDETYELTDNEYKLLGLWIADGHITKHGMSGCKITISVGEKKYKYVDSIISDSDWFSERENQRAYGLSKRNHEKLFDLIVRYCGSHSTGKVLPQFFTPKQYELILDGYRHGDGSENSNPRIKSEYWTAATVSKSLAYSLAYAGIMAGWKVGLNERAQKETGYVLGRTVNLAPFVYTLSFCKPEHRQKIKQEHLKDRVLTPVTKVTYGDVETVYNLTVSGDNTYIANNMAVHNCLLNVRLGFGITRGAYASAKDDMEAQKAGGTLHDISTMPTDVSVPIYCDTTSKYEHVIAYCADDGCYYSDGKKVNLGSFKVFGWGELCDGARVVSGAVPTPKKQGFLPARGYWMKGDNDERVGQLAEFMYKTFPAYTSKKALGNYYGPNLISAIKTFQKRTGLQADGNTGPATYAKLKQYGFKG